MSCHVEGQWAFHTDISRYIMHTIEDNVDSRHVKDKTSTLSSVPLHYRPSRWKYLYTIWSLGFHSLALDAEFTFFQDNVFLSKIAHV